jgi:hypothetical protein
MAKEPEKQTRINVEKAKVEKRDFNDSASRKISPSKPKPVEKPRKK